MNDTPKAETHPGEAQTLLIVPDISAGSRLDAFVSSQMPPHISRSRIKTLIKSGAIKIDNQTLTKPDLKVQPGMMITLIIPPALEPVPQAEPIDLDIIHEDQDIIVINKPARMVTHPAPGNWQGTLVNALLYHCKSSLSGIGGIKRPGIVHRLDKLTSGVMVAAKNEAAHLDLCEQFADHGRTGALRRAYHALVWGVPDKFKDNIKTHLGRSANNRLKRAVVNANNPGAKEAITHYRMIEPLGKPENGKTGEAPLMSLVECHLETGRTHQIRVHMAHIGHALVGDGVYGSHLQSKVNRLPQQIQPLIKNLSRQALHAQLLTIKHPRSAEIMTFEAPLPDDMREIVEQLKIHS